MSREEKDLFNVFQLFLSSSEKFPDKVAILHGKKQVTYSELANHTKTTAQYFSDKGISRGDRVLVLVPMSIDLYRNVMALFAIGAVAVFPEAWVGRKRLEACVENANCKAVVATFGVKLLGLLSPAIRKIPIHCQAGLRSNGNKLIRMAKTSPSDAALITFTTGSTGAPKAALRTHGILEEQFRALAGIIQPVPDDVDMPLLPVMLLINLGVGSTSVIASYQPAKPLKFDPAKILGLMKRHGVNRLVSSPFFVKMLSQFVLESKTSPPESLKAIFTGGAPVFPAEAVLYSEAFPDARSTIVYGSTEAEPVSFIDVKVLAETRGNLEKGLNVGCIAEGADVRIIQIADGPIVCEDERMLKSREVAEGEIGEIIVSGNHVLNDYLNNPQAVARNKIRVGDTWWHRTGDSGFLNKGRLFLTGRCATLIVRGSQVVPPFVYEGLFQSVKGVGIGTIMEVRGQLVVAIEPDQAELCEVIELKIRETGVNPDQIVFLKRIPRDPRHYSKVDYEKLRSLLAAKL